ncbi:MAG: NAD(P)-binding domain-containing protein, partial [Balneolaceae bacterium]|nr:NAD(P)-binding domain-containing protein [Balneolaceae bacterium]
MKIGIFGTGMVGRTLAGKIMETGHEVMIGTRNVETTLARTEPDGQGNPPIGTWLESRPEIRLGTFRETAEESELLLNATAGTGSLEALKAAGEKQLAGKILVDVSNPLDFSEGFPPILTVCNTDSLGEQIQRAYPDLKVVKTL